MKLTRSFFLVAVVCGLLCCSLVLAQSSHKRAAKSASAVRAVSTDELLGLLKPAAGRPLLVNYWATWCDGCREEFPDLVKIDEQYRAKGLDFISVSLDDVKEIKTEVPKFLKQMRARMPAYLLNVSDPEPAITAIDKEWAGALPATYLYDAQGQVVYKHFGPITPAELRAAIDKVMEKRAIGDK
jgi:thiol-disulfide isomerase/thioredoxin